MYKSRLLSALPAGFSNVAQDLPRTPHQSVCQGTKTWESCHRV